jgi:transposase
MCNYKLNNNVMAHFPAIAKGVGSKPSVIHLALDVELHGGVLAARVSGGRPIDCGKCSRSMILSLIKELIERKHRVVLVEEACGFGYAFHRQLRALGVEAYVVATEMLNRKRKTNRRDAAKLLDQLYDFDVNDHKKALRPIRVPTLSEQKSLRLCRMRSHLIKVRNILEGQGRGLMFDFDFHEVPPGWWEPRKWPRLRGKLLEHDPWLIQMLEHHQRLLIAQQRRIAELEREIAHESNYNGCKVAKGLGPSEFSTGPNQRLGSIDRMGNRRMRTLLVEAIWRFKKWNPGWRGFRKFPHVFAFHATARGATRKKAVVACARLLAVDLWRLQTGRATLKDLGLKPAYAR